MKFAITIIVLITFLTGCEKLDVEKGTPRCVRAEIRKAGTCTEHVTRYTYKGQTVYVFDGDNCDDGAQAIIDDRCRVLCVLGGIAGNHNDPGCPNFWQEVTQPVLIWQRE